MPDKLWNMTFHQIKFQFNFLSQQIWTHGQKKINVSSIDFAKTPFLVLLSKSSIYSSRSFSFSNSFCVKSNFHENCQSSRSFIKVSSRKVITSINLVLAKFRHWPYSNLKFIYLRAHQKFENCRFVYVSSNINEVIRAVLFSSR